jgi:hypothetical protein
MCNAHPELQGGSGEAAGRLVRQEEIVDMKRMVKVSSCPSTPAVRDLYQVAQYHISKMLHRRAMLKQTAFHASLSSQPCPLCLPSTLLESIITGTLA